MSAPTAGGNINGRGLRDEGNDAAQIGGLKARADGKFKIAANFPCLGRAAGKAPTGPTCVFPAGLIV